MDNLGAIIGTSRVNLLKNNSLNTVDYHHLVNREDNVGHSSPRNRQNPMYSSQDNPYLVTSSSTAALANSDIISTINQFSKESKNMISKLIE